MKIIAMRLGVSALFLNFSSLVFAVENVSFAKKFALVGVIAQSSSPARQPSLNTKSDPNSIAVIKDLRSQKTFTLKLGDKVPNHAHLYVQQIRRGRVELMDSARQLVHIVTSQIDADPRPQRLESSVSSSLGPGDSPPPFEEGGSDFNMDSPPVFTTTEQNTSDFEDFPHEAEFMGGGAVYRGSADQDQPPPFRDIHQIENMFLNR